MKRKPRVFLDQKGRAHELFPVDVLAELLNMAVHEVIVWEEAGVLPSPRFRVRDGYGRRERWYTQMQMHNVTEAVRMHAEAGDIKRLKKVISQVFYLDSPAGPRDLQPRRFLRAYGPKTIFVRDSRGAEDGNAPERNVSGGVPGHVVDRFDTQLVALVKAIIPFWERASESTDPVQRAHAEVLAARIEALQAYAMTRNITLADAIADAWHNKQPLRSGAQTGATDPRDSGS